MWISIYGIKYDVQNFQHPGGLDAISLGYYRDATILFQQYHPPSAKEVLKKLPKLGTYLDPFPQFGPKSEFHESLEVKKLKFSWITVSIYFFIYSLVLCSYFLLFFGFWLGLLASIVLGFGCALVGLHPMHDNSHFSFTSSPTIWCILASTHDFINGASHLVWRYQHIVGHHPYTNIKDADPDIHVNENDFRRILKTQKGSFKHQHLYVPLLYGLLALKTRIQDVFILISRQNGNIKMNVSQKQMILFWLGKLFFLSYRVFFVMYQIGVFRCLLYLFVSDLVTSYWLALTFQLNHVVEDVQLPVDLNERDWAKIQISTTMDYEVDSFFWALVTGSLNLQTIHHLYPATLQIFYPKLRLLVLEKCEKFKIQLNHKKSFLDAFKSHINHLKKLQ